MTRSASHSRARSWGRVVVRVAVIAGIAAAAWLWPASVHIVDWSDTGPARVAVVPPLGLLWLALALATMTVAGLSWMIDRTDRHTRSRSDAPFDNVLSPLLMLWLVVVPYLPWLPDRVPLLLVFAGPIRWLLAVVACGWSIARLARARTWSRPVVMLPDARTVFAISFVLYVVLGLRSAAVIGITGDEPQYLIITHSLLTDGDLRIENNHKEGDYRSFYGMELPPDFLRRGRDGQIYSIHAPGLPALLVPAYGIGGHRGAIVTMALFGACAALGVFRLASMMAGTAVGWIVWAAIALSVPFVPYAWSIFPEIAGAALAVWALVWLASPAPPPSARWLLRGLSLAVLPWLHTKFIILLAGFTCALVWKLRTTLKSTALFLLPIAVSLVAWFGSFYVIYGSLDPQAPYGSFARDFVKFENIPRGMLGLFLDQKFGLFTYAPVYLLAFPGLWLAARDARWRSATISAAVIAAAFVGTTARFYMWWGGYSAPARFLVPVLPLTVPALAAVAARGRVWRGTLLCGIALSAAIAITGVIHMQQRFLFSDAHGRSRLFEWLEGSAPLTTSLPTFTEAATRSPFAHRQFARDDSVLRGRLGVLRAYDPDRMRAYDYSRRTRVMREQWIGAGRIAIARVPSLPDDDTRVAGPLTLPPGRYEATVTFAEHAAGTVDLMTRFGAGLVRRVSASLDQPAVVPVDVPADGLPWSMHASDRGLPGLVSHVEITPRAIVPTLDRRRISARAAEAIEGRNNAFVLYLDDRSYPEGGIFWTKDTRAARVMVKTGGAGELDLTLHVGTNAGLVRVTVGDESRDVVLSADETRTMTLPLPSGAEWIPVQVRASAGFRPIDVDPASQDARALGCQVRISVR